MLMFTKSAATVRELDHRRSDAIDVRLLWHPRTDRVLVSVEDQRTGEYFELDVPGTDALEAFHHPFAYSRRGDHDDRAVWA